MVLDLFTGSGNTPSGRAGRHRSAAAVSSSVSRSNMNDTTNTNNTINTSVSSSVARTSGRRRGRAADASSANVSANTEEERQLFVNCVSQVQRNLKAHANSPSTLHTLASYYTRVEPYIEGRPFCVSLSYATFLFHMQMARIAAPDVELYVQLIANALSQLSPDEHLRHPFVQQVLRDHVLGLPSPTCRGAAHCVVLVPPQQYHAFSTMATALLALDIVPLDIVYQFQDKLEYHCNASSPIVANRALALLVQTVSEVRVDEQVTALQYVLRTKPVKMNVDFLLACYERLKRAVLDPANGPTYGRALSIHCSELFLRFRSPIRREYVERFLYPSLCHSDMAGYLAIPVTREHLLKELLSLCTPGMGTASPYYMCLCAMMQSCFDDEIDGALETVTLINCRMPHAAYFVSALAVDSRMSVSMFAKVVIALSRGAGLAMTGRDVDDEVATCISRSRTSVYNVLFTLREVVRSCSVTSSRRATDMLKALRVAVPTKSIEALGKLSSEAFDGRCDITVDPQLLCAELAMVLHHEHIEAAAESAVDYFRDVTTQCHFCGMQRSASLLCPVNGTVHVTGQTSVSRVLSTLAECAGAKVLEERMIRYLRDPATQMDSAVHFLLYHILASAGQHRNAFFVQLEPYLRSTLMALVSADRSSGRGLVGSEHKANVLMLHVKAVMLLAAAVDPSYLESILKVFTELKVRNNHDALALWLMGNLLLRNCKGNVELLPTDPSENNYCVDYPGCAPSSATCADNAQLVLRLLDRAHSFSAEMRKLVGCCVCKLVQDFNVQAPNILMTLLSSYGFVPTGLPSLTEFALPVGAGSTFWNFFLQQMKTSAPARTAFMAALAKSMSRRFRIATPADAIAPHGVEATGHLFTVMMCEAMKRNPPLARVVLFMISHWMKQADHQPGKFVCLVYVCTQLVTAIMERAGGPAPVEVEAETSQDRHQFDDSAKKAAKLLKSQQVRLEKLLPAVRRDNNTAFLHLIRRLQRKVRRTVALVNGDAVPGLDEDDDDRGEDVDGTLNGTDAGAPYSRDDDVVFHQQQQPQPYSSTIMALQELHNTADDSVFDDLGGGAVAGGQDGEEDDYNAVEMEGLDTTNYGNSHATLVLSNISNAGHGPQQRIRVLSSGSIHNSNVNTSASLNANHSSSSVLHAPGEISSILKKRSTTLVGESVRRPTAAYHDNPNYDHRGEDPIGKQHHHHQHQQYRQYTDVDGPSEVQVVEGVEDVSVEVARGGRGYPHPYNYSRQYNNHSNDSRIAAKPRSQSRGVQTDDEDFMDGEQQAGTASPGVNRQRELASEGAATRALQHKKRSHDKGVTAPFEQSVGTSPIQIQEAAAAEGAKADGSPRVTSGRFSTWQEPELDDYVQGDATPIEETGVPLLQATTGHDGGAVLPSGMVLEYLRTHQAMDSLRHEMDQLDQNTILQQVAQYVQQHTISSPSASNLQQHQHQHQHQQQMVTMEGRANNYSAPHQVPCLVPGRTVVAPVTMVSTTPTATGSRRHPTVAGQQQRRADAVENNSNTNRGEEDDEQYEVVDGERPVHAVSETALSKRRRTEGEAATATTTAAVAQPPPVLAAPQTPSHNLRGMHFFLHQQQFAVNAAGNGGASALQDLEFMQRQRGAMEALAQQHQQHQQMLAAEEEGEETSAWAERENLSPTGRPVTGLASEGLPPTTPFGQVVIPACFVEQRNDTAIRELRQAMGAHNANDTRLSSSTHGKPPQRIRGTAQGPASPTNAGDNNHNSDPNTTGSGAWWSEMSTAPMPGYAADPQYSMELF